MATQCVTPRYVADRLLEFLDEGAVVGQPAAFQDFVDARAEIAHGIADVRPADVQAPQHRRRAVDGQVGSTSNVFADLWRGRRNRLRIGRDQTACARVMFGELILHRSIFVVMGNDTMHMRMPTENHSSDMLSHRSQTSRAGAQAGSIACRCSRSHLRRARSPQNPRRRRKSPARPARSRVAPDGRAAAA